MSYDVNSYPGPVAHQVLSGPKARAGMLKGAAKLAMAVGSTLGPAGQAVVIERPGQTPLLTKDGVTVARAINLRDPLESLGAELVKEVAAKTNEVSGDGTTTATVLAHSILENGHKALTSGHAAVGVKRGIDLGTKRVLDEVMKTKVLFRDHQDIENIGTISANGDREIGKLLATALSKVGRDGTITIEPAKSIKTSLEFVSGFQFDTGFWSPYFVTNPEKLSCVLEDCWVWVTNRKVSTIQEILPVIEEVHKTQKPILIVVDDIDQEPLSLLVANKMKNLLQVCVVKAPYYGEYRTEVLGDLTTVVGGEVFDSSNPTSLKEASLQKLGKAQKVVVTKSTTLIVGYETEQTRERVAKVVQDLRTALDAEDGGGFQDQGHRDRTRQRLARVCGGVAVIRVGGTTEPEILEKKDRVEDALNATVAAYQEGIVAGGGTALFRAALRVGQDPEWQGLGEDERAGIRLLLAACEAPLRTIVKNAGVSPDVVMSRLRDAGPDSVVGYNAATDTYGDLMNEGVIDPVKVTRTALENAASVAGLLLMCNAVVVQDTATGSSNSDKEISTWQ